MLVFFLFRDLSFPFIKSYKAAKESHIISTSILKEILARHESTFDPNSVRNIIDSYKKERNNWRSKGYPIANYFTGNKVFKFARIKQTLQKHVQNL